MAFVFSEMFYTFKNEIQLGIMELKSNFVFGSAIAPLPFGTLKG